MVSYIESAWYKRWSFTYLLAPLALIFFIVSTIRRWLFKLGIKKSQDHNALVIVVGNISVGGTGKTPFVIYLVRLIQSLGYKPGVVSRGYGVEDLKSTPFPRKVNDLSVALSGDEPKLIANNAKVPVVIDPDRNRAIQYLVDNNDIDVVISDDGLQHYQMSRDIEVVVYDLNKKFGNGWLLPVGPLREFPSRLSSVDITVGNAGFSARQAEYSLVSGSVYSLQTLSTVESQNTAVHLVTGIGNPERFVTTAKMLGFELLTETFFQDHHPFTEQDFAPFSKGDKVLITEKDMVKCEALNIQAEILVLPIQALVSAELELKLSRLIKQKYRNKLNGV